MALPYEWTQRDVLALTLAGRNHAVDLRKAIEEYRSLDHLLRQPAGRLGTTLRQSELFQQCDAEMLSRIAEQTISRLENIGASFCTYWDENYPLLLRQISYPPTVLYFKGTLKTADALAIAIVGTRRCTTYGRLCTERFASDFARAGCVVVSGLATGIDSIAHKATLEAGGVTYAVIASGLDCIQPSTARRLSEQIIEHGGVVLTEYPLGTVARPAYFPQRNRIISGIARAVLVVESRREGGSLITAHFAVDQARDLFAVPGNITAPTSEGTNMLIAQQKALLALSTEQVLSELGIHPSEGKETVQREELLSQLEDDIWKLIEAEPKSADDLAVQLAVPIGEILSTLLMMEFRGLVRQLPGKQFIRLR